MKKIIVIFLSILVLIGTFFFFFKNRQNKNAGYDCEDCNIIVISLSNLRKKNMSFYGNSRKTTPNIDEYFKNSFSFDRAIAPASLTFTDSTSLFYSLQPDVHQYMNRNDRPRVLDILKKYKSLPKILSEYGYSTAAFVSDEDYAYENGLGPEFDLYFDKNAYQDYGIPFKPWQYNVGTKNLVGPTLKWLKKNHNKKFFLFLQAYDMHCPYTPQKNVYQGAFNQKIDFSACYMTFNEMEKIKIREKTFFKLYNWEVFLNKEKDEGVLFEQRDLDQLVNLYDSELKEADSNLAEMFAEIKTLDLEKKTIVIFLSEHGDYLGEAGYFMKAAVTGRGNLHNANLSYPLLINHPHLKGPYKQMQLVQTIDLGPTILEMVGLEKPEAMQGKSFLNALGNDKQINDYALSSAIRQRSYKDLGKFKLQSLQNREWKYDYFEHRDFSDAVILQEEKLYNLTSDPKEQVDLKDKEKEKLSFMRKIMNEKLLYYKK